MKNRTGIALGLALLVAVLVSFLPALESGFIWNDDTYVTENPTLDGLSGLLRIWTDTGANEQYYPLVFTTYWIEKRLWGLHPFGYHLVNILVHAGAALLLWQFLRRLGLPAAWFAAATFAIHPLCVESVAWITELKNTLSLVLVLAAAHAWLSWRTALEERDAPPRSKAKHRPAPGPAAWRRPGLLWTAALVLFTLALQAKTTASVLPAVLLVIVWWQRGRLRWSDVRPMLPFFAIGAGLAFHTAWLERTMVRATGTEWALSLADRFVLAGQVTVFYAGKVLWPVNLAFSYPRWTVDARIAAQWIPTTALCTALLAAWLLVRRGRRGPLAGLLLFGGVLFPAMGFFNVYAMRYSWVADHFAYQAVAVATACVVCGIASVVEGLGSSWQKPLAAAGAAGLLVLGAMTFQLARAYKTQETLWLHTLAKNPDCFLCLTNYARDLLQAGRTDEAVAHLEKSLKLKPDAVPTLLNLARVEEEQGRLEGAATHLRAALAVDSTDDEVRVHLATVYTKAGRLADAIREYQVALGTPSPEDYLAHNGLGVALIRAGRLAEGIDHMRECVRLRPDYEHGRANLEMALAMTGRR